VFYLPDLPALLQCEQQHQQQQWNKQQNKDDITVAEKEAEELEEEEAIGFYPLRLNASQQPMLPLIVEGTITASNKLYMPIFVRPSATLRLGHYTIHVSVECVPIDVMTSAAVAGDFKVPVTLHQPWVARHNLRCHENNQVFAPTLQASRDTTISTSSSSSSSASSECWRVTPQTSLSLDTSLHCLYTLSTPSFAALLNHHKYTGTAVVSAAEDDRAAGGATPQPTLAAETRLGLQPKQQLLQAGLQSLQIRRIEHLRHTTEHNRECVDLHFVSDSGSTKEYEEDVVALQREETYHRSLYFSTSHNSNQSQRSTNTDTEVSLGEYEVQWRDRSVCPLRPSPKLFEALWGPLGEVVSDIGFFPRAASRFHWLLFAHRRPDISQPLPWSFRRRCTPCIRGGGGGHSAGHVLH
jgi:hypothetical protein